MYERKTPEDLDCGLIIAMKIFGAKWKPCIIDAINRGFHRPSEMHRGIYMATPRVIDMQLRELEEHGIVVKQPGMGFPLKTEYYLSPLGESILPVIAQLDRWGSKNKDVVRPKAMQEAIV